jgi:hypothetical protein
MPVGYRGPVASPSKPPSGDLHSKPVPDGGLVVDKVVAAVAIHLAAVVAVAVIVTVGAPRVDALLTARDAFVRTHDHGPRAGSVCNWGRRGRLWRCRRRCCDKQTERRDDTRNASPGHQEGALPAGKKAG